jgi:hypothetical protein
MLDFRPDLDPRTPGLLTWVSEMLPLPGGSYTTAIAEVDYGLPYTYTLIAGETWPNVCFASRWNSAPGGIVIVGTNKRLNVLSPGVGYINVSKAGDYALGGTPYQYPEDAFSAFDLCAFGDVIIACNNAVTAQKRNALDLTGATLFSDLGGATAAPTANTCCVAANFVFLGACGNWSTVTGARDILAWSAIGDHTDWRVNPQVTQSSYAQFVDTPGAITAVRQFRDGVVVFKANSMYRGRYVGAGPNSPIWDFERISDEIGCIGHRSVVNTGEALVFVHAHDIYAYDGTRPRTITHGIRQFIEDSQLFIGNIYGQFPLLLGYARQTDSVVFCGYTMSLVWNSKLDKWGMLSTSQTTQPIPCQTNTAHFRSLLVTGVSGGVETIAIGSEFTNLDTLRIFNGTTKNRNTSAIPPSALITGWYGQHDKLQTLSRVTPVLLRRPTTTAPTLPPSMEVTVYGSKTLSNATSLGSAYLNADFRFDTLGANPNTVMTGSTQNFFIFRIDAREWINIMDVVPKFTPAGER